MDLKKWASGQTRFVRLSDGDSLEAVFLKATEIEDTFNPGKTKIRYALEVDNEQKFLESSSGTLAREMYPIEEGEVIKITRTGEGMNTRYKVEKVVSKELSDEDEEKIAKAVK